MIVAWWVAKINIPRIRNQNYYHVLPNRCSWLIVTHGIFHEASYSDATWSLRNCIIPTTKIRTGSLQIGNTGEREFISCVSAQRGTQFLKQHFSKTIYGSLQFMNYQFSLSWSPLYRHFQIKHYNQHIIIKQRATIYWPQTPISCLPQLLAPGFLLRYLSLIRKTFRDSRIWVPTYFRCLSRNALGRCADLSKLKRGFVQLKCICVINYINGIHVESCF